MTLTSDFKHTWEKNGAKLEATVSPCSFMYKNYGLQLTVVMENGGNIIVPKTSISMEKATVEDALALCETVEIVPCKCCGKPAFDPSNNRTNREGMCEGCWMDAWAKEVAELQKKEQAAILRRDKRFLKKGYTHRVTGWVHPEAGGDDYAIDLYTVGKLTPKEIKAELKRLGSRVFDDYRIVSLEDAINKKIS